MTDEMRADAHRILLAALTALDPARLVAEALPDLPVLAEWSPEIATVLAGSPTGSIDRRAYGATWTVAIGKAAGGMTAGARAVFGDQLTGGIVVLPDGAPSPELPARFEVYRAAHPLPDERSLVAADAIRRLTDGVGPGDRILVLLSGGGSALVTDPAGDLDLAAIRATHDVLLRSGLPIQRVNEVRRVLDRLKGGGLAVACAPASVVGLVLSDIPGGRAEDVASGPLSPPPLSPRGVEIALRRHRIWDRLPGPVREHLRALRDASVPETPSVPLHVVGSGPGVIEAVRRAALARGYGVHRLGDALEGEARRLGRSLARAAMAAQDGMAPVPLPACLVATGEATVTVRGAGTGGPNQEVAVGAALALAGREGIVLAALGTDGVDGPTEAAGAWADGTSAARAAEAGVDLADALERNDTGRALAAIGDRIITGSTGTNVADLYLALVAPLPVSDTRTRTPGPSAG
ncbi:MAG: DUF4147 domain-containing protein [Longimicrobiales bacterium]|nr:DUF4147 domain-containing protein [Longimicrobiales bacterium]